MNLNRFPRRHHQGSILLGVVLVVLVLSLLLGTVLRYSSNTHRNSVRQTRIEKAKLIAESEMEYLFYRWISEVNRGTASDDIDDRLVADGFIVADPTADMTPFSASIAADGWTISRSITFHRIPDTHDGSATGNRPGTNKTGRNYYFVARTRATITDPSFGKIEYRLGRRFVRSETSLLQFAVFYQDDLEIASGSNMTIKGPISTNGSAYIGAQSGVEIYITDKVSVGGSLNGGTNAVDGTQLRKPGASGSSTLHDPIFDTDLEDGTLPDQTAARTAQYEKLNAPENFIGGVDLAKALENPVYNNDPNEVYRSIIAPPPRNSSGDLIEEDPTVQNRRMYNRAGIVVTVGVDSVTGDAVVNVGTSTNPTAFNTAIGDALKAQVFPELRKDVFDKRENRFVKVTTMDVERLNHALASIPSLGNAYNGVLYVHDNTNGSGSGSAIRMKNAEATPDFKDAYGAAKGFALVSDNPVYVQGDYNTKKIVENSVTRDNPAAIMADAVTLLSAGWNDDNSTHTIDAAEGARVADMLGQGPKDGYSTAENTMTVNSAILTGNTPSTGPDDPGPATNSGGVQNIVRLMEDWWGPALNIKLKGSIGQLFKSKYFNSPFKSTGVATPDGDPSVYYIPDSRELEFDEDLAKRPPPWTPTTTEFHRGDIFLW